MSESCCGAAQLDDLAPRGVERSPPENLQVAEMGPYFGLFGFFCCPELGRPGLRPSDDVDPLGQFDDCSGFFEVRAVVDRFAGLGVDTIMRAV